MTLAPGREGMSVPQSRVILADKHSHILGGIRRLLEDEVKKKGNGLGKNNE